MRISALITWLLDLMHFLLATRDIAALRELERFYNTQVEEMPMNVADLI